MSGQSMTTAPAKTAGLFDADWDAFAPFFWIILTQGSRPLASPPALSAFGKGMGRPGRDSMHPIGCESRDAERNPSPDAVADEIGAADAGMIEHRDHVPAAMDWGVSRRIGGLAAVAMTAQIDQDHLPAARQTRLDTAALVPRTAGLAEVMQQRHRCARTEDIARAR